jgi:hypothetical protein
LDSLLDHRAEFELLVIKTYGNEPADQIDWTNPRLLRLRATSLSTTNTPCSR